MSERSRGLDGYVRVSKVAGREGESYISPSVQREQIERWAGYRHELILEWWVDEDWSGGAASRPGLDAAVERAVNGESSGIVCARIDRFSRNTAQGLRDLERLRDAGARLVFVSEDVDTGTPIGKLVYTVMLAQAEYFLASIRASWAAATTRAIGRGAKTGPVPYGYRKADSGVLEPDPEMAENVREAYRLAASRGPAVAAEYLRGVDGDGHMWTTAATRRMLGKRTYLGEQAYGDVVNPDAHEPLVSRAVWEAAQTAPQPRVRRGFSPLSGLAVCGTCLGPMVTGQSGTREHRVRTYRCAATLALYKGEKCQRGASIRADTLEQHVRERLVALFAGREVRVGDDVDADRGVLLERAIADAEAELDAFASDLTMRRALGARYHQHLQERVTAVEDAQQAYRAWAQEAQQVTVLDGTALTSNVSDVELRELLGGIAGRVLVRPGRSNVLGRVTLVVGGQVVDGPALDGDALARISGLGEL